ncbi:ArsR family transcriptional regulator [uncultured Friedmanniella sp.]|uniref:ArsR family transcriptional regulator n=1 Tax=uncultured Friedmanniella sp. TaxID=335381 RepID=UPI0035CB3A54
MSIKHSPLLAIFRSPLQGRILAEVYLHARDETLTITALARQLEAPFPSVRREVNRLIEVGLLAEQQVGRARTLSRPASSLVVGPLTDLLNVTFGPLPVMTELLSGVEGVSEAYLYGSWAARYRGEHGAEPRDVDILVVGEADVDALDHAAQEGERRLRREVNIRRISEGRWADPGSDPFLRHVQDRPLVAITAADALATIPAVVGEPR